MVKGRIKLEEIMKKIFKGIGFLLTPVTLFILTNIISFDSLNISSKFLIFLPIVIIAGFFLYLSDRKSNRSDNEK